MKIQIRRGVFETNSSSTHSLQLIHNNVDCMLELIGCNNKPGNNVYRSDEFKDISKWIKDNTLCVTHLNLIYSDYSRSYNYIFDTPMSKIIFVGMLYFGLSKKFFDSSSMESHEIVEKMKTYPLFDQICDIVFKELKKLGYKNVTTIDWNPRKFIRTYKYSYNEHWNNLFSNNIIDETKLLTLIKRIFKQNFSIVFSDIAYFSGKTITYII